MIRDLIKITGKRLVDALVDRVRGTSPRVVVMESDAPISPHKNVVEAISETQGHISQVRMETRERNKWMYMLTDEPEAWVVAFFGRPDGTPSRIGYNALGKRMVAVWRGVNGVEAPDSEPVF